MGQTNKGNRVHITTSGHWEIAKGHDCNVFATGTTTQDSEVQKLNQR